MRSPTTRTSPDLDSAVVFLSLFDYIVHEFSVFEMGPARGNQRHNDAGSVRLTFTEKRLATQLLLSPLADSVYPFTDAHVIAAAALHVNRRVIDVKEHLADMEPAYLGTSKNLGNYEASDHMAPASSSIDTCAPLQDIPASEFKFPTDKMDCAALLFIKLWSSVCAAYDAKLARMRTQDTVTVAATKLYTCRVALLMLDDLNTVHVGGRVRRKERGLQYVVVVAVATLNVAGLHTSTPRCIAPEPVDLPQLCLSCYIFGQRWH